jgi:hypothetical protein
MISPVLKMLALGALIVPGLGAGSAAVTQRLNPASLFTGVSCPKLTL